MHKSKPSGSSWSPAAVELTEVSARTSALEVDIHVLPSEPTGQHEAGPSCHVPDIDGAREGRSSLRRRRWRPGWVQRVREFNPCLVLENSGSVARDHLAVERTFLAYVRTSLGMATMGVTLVQLLALTINIPGRLQLAGQIMGAVIVGVGLGVLVIAVVRYFSMQNTLLEGKYKPAGTIVLAIAFAIGAVILVMFGLLLGVAFG